VVAQILIGLDVVSKVKKIYRGCYSEIFLEKIQPRGVICTGSDRARKEPELTLIRKRKKRRFIVSEKEGDQIQGVLDSRRRREHTSPKGGVFSNTKIKLKAKNEKRFEQGGDAHIAKKDGNLQVPLKCSRHLLTKIKSQVGGEKII